MSSSEVVESSAGSGDKMDSGSPKVFLYSLLLPAIWIFFGLTIGAMFPGAHIGTFGTTVMFLAIVLLMCWLFVRRHHREFSVSEYRRIVAYTVGWAFLFESVVLLALFSDPGQEIQFTVGMIAFTVLFAMAFDTLVIWLSFRNFGKKLMKSYVEKRCTSQIKADGGIKY